MITISIDYIAGFVDGEGSIAISEHRRNSRDTPEGHQISLSIGNTDLQVLEDIKTWMESLGAKILIRRYDPSDKIKSKQTFYQLFTYGNNLKLIIPELLPSLRIKTYQAILALEFLDTMDGSNRPVGKEIREYRTYMARKMSWLNQGCP